MKSKYVMVLVIFAITLAGCSKVKSFETSIDSIRGETWMVNCSNEANRNKKGNINAIGYLCHLELTDDTNFLSADSSEMTIDDFAEGDKIQITLAKPVNIIKKNRTLEAKEIRLLRSIDD